MEAPMLHSSPDQPISPYKTTPIMKTHRKGAGNGINRPSISRPSENFVLPLNLHNNIGLLQSPPQVLLPPNYNLFHSYPLFSMSMQQQQQQPPLLPLPISSTKPNKANISAIQHPRLMRGISCPPTTNRKAHNKVAKSRNSSLTPKKSKTISPTKQESLKPLGPHPKDLPKDVPKTSTLLSRSSGICGSNSSANATRDQQVIDRFSGPVVFTISPPPSSLPLPTFSLRPKLSCNAEAAGVDAGATDNLCRLLRLG